MPSKSRKNLSDDLTKLAQIARRIISEVSG